MDEPERTVEVEAQWEEAVREQVARDVKLAEVVVRAGGRTVVADMADAEPDMDRRALLVALENWHRALERHRRAAPDPPNDVLTLYTSWSFDLWERLKVVLGWRPEITTVVELVPRGAPESPTESQIALLPPRWWPRRRLLLPHAPE